MSEPRESLIEELRNQGISDESVLSALAHVPRDCFVPEQFSAHAWANVALPIGAGQTISQPYIVALMSQALGLRGDERVLEIGTGSGYQAAVLATLAREVISVERHALLGRGAASLLHDLGFSNVRVMIGDGTLGWPAEAPYRGILVTAAAPHVPARLIDQLDPTGGVLVIPVGTLDDQDLIAVTRQGDTTQQVNLGGVRFVPLVGQDAWGPAAGNGNGQP